MSAGTGTLTPEQDLALRERIEELAKRNWVREAAVAVGVPFSREFGEKWDDLREALRIKEGIWDGSIEWRDRYSFEELRGYGDPQEMAMDMSLCDLGWAIDDLISLRSAK